MKNVFLCFIALLVLRLQTWNWQSSFEKKRNDFFQRLAFVRGRTLFAFHGKPVGGGGAPIKMKLLFLCSAHA